MRKEKEGVGIIYKNNDPLAIHAMELDRTGNYGELNIYESDGFLTCPICKNDEAEYLYKNNYNDEIVGCDECVLTVTEDEEI